MKRKFFILFLSTILVICITIGLPACDSIDSSSVKSGGITYTLSDDGTYSVTNATNQENIEILSEINGIAVTSIAKDAFENCGSTVNIIIPNSITTINERAFYGCGILTDITIPDSITYIGQDVFNSALLNFYEYSNGYYLGNETNNYIVLYKAKSQSITSIEIHENTKIIYCSACYMCNSLKEITIPSGVTCIGGSAFSSCPLITELVIPDSVLYILDAAFGPNAIESLTLGNSLIYIGNGAFYNCSFPKVEIPNSVTYIGALAFAENDSLNTVTLGNNVSTIGDTCFQGCKSLTEINIPDNVTYIGMGAFSVCKSLINLTIGKGVTYIGEYAFEDCVSLKFIYYNGTIEEWNAIEIESRNTCLTDATIYYNN